MFVYRLQKSKYATSEAILSGEGASRTSGRWNPRNTPLIYTSCTPELALLEVLVHIEGATLEDLPPFSLVILEVPKTSIIILEINDLPVNWQKVPTPPNLSKVTENWLVGQSSLCLKIPSVVMPFSYNCLLNPRHRDIDQVKIVEVLPFSFDQRLAP
jgi:RES domain-containing protein